MSRSVLFAAMLTVLGAACSSNSNGISSSKTEVASSGESTGSMSGDLSDSEFCRQVREMDSGEKTVESPDDVVTLFDDLVEKAPEAIVDDLTVVRDAIAEAGDTIVIDNGNLEFPAELSENPLFTAASDSVGRFSQEECGV